MIYSFGVGDEISFDLQLIRRLGATVHAFDPTPRSVAWVGGQRLPKEFVFHGYGLGANDGSCKFKPPSNPRHVSHTVVEREGPWPCIELPIYRLSTILRMLDHSIIDLLKMDIEGAEYEALTDILNCRLPVMQLLVEFHHRWPEVGLEKTRRAVADLNAAGYQIFSVSPNGEEYGFVRNAEFDSHD